jgi:hypothetical protein
VGILERPTVYSLIRYIENSIRESHLEQKSISPASRTNHQTVRALNTRGQKDGTWGKKSCAQDAKSGRLCVMDFQVSCRGSQSPWRSTDGHVFGRLGPLFFDIRSMVSETDSFLSLSHVPFYLVVHFNTFSSIFDSILSPLIFLAILIGVAPLVRHLCYKHCLDSKPQCLTEFGESCLGAASRRHSLRRPTQTTAKDFPGQRRSRQNKPPEILRGCRSHRLIKSLSRNSHSLRTSRLSSVLPAIRPLLLPQNGRNERSLTILMLDFCHCRQKSFFTYSSTCLCAAKSPCGNLAPVSSTFIQRRHFTLQVTTNSILSV